MRSNHVSVAKADLRAEQAQAAAVPDVVPKGTKVGSAKSAAKKTAPKKK